MDLSASDTIDIRTDGTSLSNDAVIAAGRGGNNFTGTLLV